MQNHFSYRFSQNIWRILPDSDGGNNLWVIELRDATEKKVSFAVIDIAKEELVWEGAPDGTDWWSSLTAFSNQLIYLHNYRFPEIPEPTDLIAFSGRSGDMLWELPNHVLVSVLDNETIEIAQKQGDRFIKKFVNAATGELLPAFEKPAADTNEILLVEPVRYRKGNDYFEKLQAFIKERTNGHIASGIDYLERRPYVIFSYYIYEQDKTVQYLLIVTDQNQLVLHEKLSDERDGMGRSTMILKASTLVYLKNNNEFSSLTLS
ncbi:DUF4905 domain-containing protein [Dyadobacter sp. CY323]|uniref:DUF4905 domain-containing protein n=1 Tax=Dyadobacter sp. CY323 TaxID=2907302 RepID=UPI001F3E10FF|nr:DUF4905 domain-containing protein [Dyadobacter sp. CY323]MCE6991619.1 DUF4905 domain-containing protein [Dyadobacter sp. CY323]